MNTKPQMHSVRQKHHVYEKENNSEIEAHAYETNRTHMQTNKQKNTHNHIHTKNKPNWQTKKNTYIRKQ